MAAGALQLARRRRQGYQILRRAACYDDWGAFEPPHLTFGLLTDTPFAPDLAPCRRASHSASAPCPQFPHVELDASHHRLDPTIRASTIDLRRR